MRFFDPKVRNNAGYYIGQSLLASVSILGVLAFLDLVTQTGVIAALGATCFIVFTLPNQPMSSPRRVIGGYVIGIVVGAAFALMGFPLVAIFTIKWITIIKASLAVGFAILIMVLTDTEHPPAAGVSLGLVLNPWSISTLAFILGGVSILSLIKWLLRKRLKNLL